MRLVALLIVITHNTLFAASSNYTITTIYSFDEAQEAFKSCTKKSLVLFDIDDTIISSPDVLARTHAFPKDFLAKLYLKHPSFLYTKTWDYFYSFMWYHEPRLIIEPQVIAYIND
ncbi:MAG: hypothetical protein ABUT20_51780, partial [Bacteroidota bacterium]